MQVFVAAENQIDVITYQEDNQIISSRYFERKEGMFVNEQLTNETNFIIVSKGSNYLVVKQKVLSSIQVITACENRAYFDEPTFSCSACDPATVSFGLQSEKCITCNDLFAASRGDDLKKAFFKNVCMEGSAKSWMLIVFSTITLLAVSLLICAANSADKYGNEFKFESDDEEDLTLKKPPQVTNTRPESPVHQMIPAESPTKKKSKLSSSSSVNNSESNSDPEALQIADNQKGSEQTSPKKEFTAPEEDSACAEHS